MITKKALLGAVLILVLAVGSAKAATFKISFDQIGGISNPVGTFVAGDDGDVTSFYAFIDGTTFNSVPPFNLTYDAGTNVLSGGVHQASPPAVFRLLGFQESGFWGVYTCVSGCILNRSIQGTYSISAIPLPAALPLLGAGLAGLAALGWVRRRKRGIKISA